MRDDREIQVRSLVKRFWRDAEWRSLWRRRAEKIVLDSVDMEVSRGEIFGLLGPNGAGKTTLVKILAGLLYPTSGTVRVGGLDVVHDGLELRRRIGLVYGDERSFFWRLSAFENLRFYASLYQLPRHEIDRRVMQLLELMDLAHAAHTRMDRFSSGMKQRMAIARGLLNDPMILLMDEPTRTLDPIGARETRRIIREQVVAGGQRTVLLATNLMVEAEQLCDRALLLKEGRVLASGSIQELRRTVQADELHVLVVSGLGRARLEELAGLPAVASANVQHLENGTYQVSLAVVRGCPTIPQAIQEIVRDGGMVWSSTPRELSLDEVFHLVVSENGARVKKSSEREVVRA